MKGRPLAALGSLLSDAAAAAAAVGSGPSIAGAAAAAASTWIAISSGAGLFRHQPQGLHDFEAPAAVGMGGGIQHSRVTAAAGCGGRAADEGTTVSTAASSPAHAAASRRFHPALAAPALPAKGVGSPPSSSSVSDQQQQLTMAGQVWAVDSEAVHQRAQRGRAQHVGRRRRGAVPQQQRVASRGATHHHMGPAKAGCLYPALLKRKGERGQCGGIQAAQRRLAGSSGK